jgi:hypothetical protein
LSVYSAHNLAFGNGNAKLPDGIYHFSLLSGYTCPGAHKCLAKVNLQTGKIMDGPEADIRCYSAMMEAMYPNLRELRQHNTKLLSGKTKQEMIDLIDRSLPVHARFIRVHIGGDFFSEDYFLAWMEVASRHPGITFYAYTKSLPFWVKNMSKVPSNFMLTASRGGLHDALIDSHELRCAEIVFSESEANIKGLEIDHDDSHAYGNDPKSFALLIHGSQKAGSPASKALSALRKSGWTGYSNKKKKGELLAV